MRDRLPGCSSRLVIKGDDDSIKRRIKTLDPRDCRLDKLDRLHFFPSHELSLRNAVKKAQIHYALPSTTCRV